MHPRAWLFAIMRNIVIDWHRASTRQVSIVPSSQEELTEIAGPGLDEALASLPGMKEEAFREFLDASVARALDALEAPFREVVILSVAGDLNYREIAEVLDCPVGTVMSRLARARRALRERLADFSRSDVRGKEVRQ
jgi:RNA polymerase sigma-70 factor (ECF subfamily)